MQKKAKRYLMYLLFIAGGGTLFQGNNAGFARCAGDNTLVAVNFCFVFDCQNGALGGAIEFCGDGPNDDVFLDCP